LRGDLCSPLGKLMAFGGNHWTRREVSVCLTDGPGGCAPLTQLGGGRGDEKSTTLSRGIDIESIAKKNIKAGYGGTPTVTARESRNTPDTSSVVS